MCIALFAVFSLAVLLVEVEGYYADRLNTRWVTRAEYDNHVRKHARQHGGEDNYLHEVSSAMAQVRAQPRDLRTGHDFLSGVRGRDARITYLGEDNNKHRYRVDVRKSNNPRLLVVTNNWEVVTYHRNN